MTDLASVVQIVLSVALVTLPFVALVRLIGGGESFVDRHERLHQEDLQPIVLASAVR